MVSNILHPRSTFPVFVALLLSAIAIDAQAPKRLVSKLDAPLSASVRARHSDTRHVIIRTTSDGMSRLTTVLKTNGRTVRRVHEAINALTADVPVTELEGLSQLSFIQSISSDAVVTADQI